MTAKNCTSWVANQALRGNETRRSDAEAKACGQLSTRSVRVFAPRAEYKVRDREGVIASTRGVCAPQLQQLVRIDVDGDGDVFWEWQFVECLTDKAAETHNGFTADQNVKTELTL